MTLFDLAGLVGVALILVAYVLTVNGRLDAREARALWLNLVGSSLILVSLVRDFNLSATIMEAAWAGTALYGLVRLAARRRPR